MTLAYTRTVLAAALDTALGDARVRVSATPIKPGALDRYKALVILGSIRPLGDELGHVGCELEVQIGIGAGIPDAYAAVDDVLEDVDAALPVAWELASWTVDVDTDDQPVLRAIADLEGWDAGAAPAAPLGDSLIIGGTDVLLIGGTDSLEIA
jgi:hypothetical protein